MPDTLAGLQPQHYEHALDRKTLDAVQGTPGLDFAVRKFWELGLERTLRVQCTGSHLKISKRFMPEIYDRVRHTCQILNLRVIPDVYVEWTDAVQAHTTGIENPILVLGSGAIELLDEVELSFVIGHEIGHIKSNHLLYHQISQVLPHVGGAIGSATLGVGNLVAGGLQLALLNWHRMSELTADRAGLLACQQPVAATRTLMKIAGLPRKHAGKEPTDAFLEQAREFDGLDSQLADRAAKWLSILWSGHPWTVLRASELDKWTTGGSYRAILDADRSDAAAPRTGWCMQCGSFVAGSDQFCTESGAKATSRARVDI